MDEARRGWARDRSDPVTVGDPSGFLHDAYAAPPHELPAVFARHVAGLGCEEAMLYLVDLQQVVLVPYLTAGAPGTNHPEPLSVESTLAGRAYQVQRILAHADDGDRVKAWVPLRRGSERVGVASVTARPGALDDDAVRQALIDMASVAAHVVLARESYVDQVVALRRRGEVGLAAEMQWALLPPLTYVGDAISLAGVLEPAYEVAGDSVDYSAGSDGLRFGVFDCMGHGRASAQTAAVAVNAFRSSRRSGRPLPACARDVDRALAEAFATDSFATAVLGHLDAASGLLSLVNAGHPSPLLFRDGHLVKSLSAASTLPLGLLDLAEEPSPASMVLTESLEPGDQVLVYTDGVVEARSPDGDMYGADRLVDTVTKCLANDLATPESMRRVTASLLAHQQDQLGDDATLLMLHWHP